jgi:hypothetical protein
MIKKMRDYDWMVFDAVDAATEHLNVPLEKGRTLSYLRDSSESIKAGWDVSLPVEIHVDDEHIYDGRYKKTIFIPWIQVELNKMAIATQIDERRTSYKE